MDMCPKGELLRHESELDPFEVDPVTGIFRSDLAVKKFERSAAGKDYKPNEIRPLPVLQKSMDHLINYVIAERTGTSSDTSEINMYHYVRERVRTIKTDITVQNLVSRGVVEILEQAVMFYVWSAARFDGEKDFDEKQNMEQLTDNLTTVLQQFDELPPEERTLECEFRALNLLVFIGDAQFYARLMQYSPDVVESGPVQKVLKLRERLMVRDIPGYLKVAAELPVQFAFFAVWSLRRAPWENLFRAMKKGLKRSFPRALLTDVLQVPEDAIPRFYGVFGIREQGDSVSFVSNSQRVDWEIPEHVIPERIRDMVTMNPCQRFMDLGTIGTIEGTRPMPVTVQVPAQESVWLPQPVEAAPEREATESEATEQSTREASESDLEKSPEPSESASESESESTSESESESESSSESESKDESESEEEPEPEPEAERMKVVKVDAPVPKKICTRPLEAPRVKMPACGFRVVRPVLSIRAMIPVKIPRLCFGNVVIVASDGSDSADFVNHSARLDDIFGSAGKFQETINVDGSELFLNIAKVPTASTTAILHCNDTEQPDYGDVPCNQFSSKDSALQPFLRFNELLRETIRASIVELYTIDLTEDILWRTLVKMFDRISTDYWYKASGNATFSIVNHFLAGIANAIESNSFVMYLPPFEHELVSITDIYEFADAIRKLQLGKLDNATSKQPQPTTWPIRVRENLEIVTPPFIVPVRCEFDPEKFCDDIVAKYETELEGPSEVVESWREANRPSFEKLLGDFDSMLCNM